MEQSKKARIYRTRKVKGSNVRFNFVLRKSRRSFWEKLVGKLKDWIGE